jgi:hypothetical protein
LAGTFFACGSYNLSSRFAFVTAAGVMPRSGSKLELASNGVV